MLKRVLSELLRRRSAQAPAAASPPQAKPPLEQAQTLFGERQDDAAAEILSGLLTAEPQNARAHCLAAEIALRRGALGDAEAGFRRALIIDADCTEAWFGLGSASQRAGATRFAHLYYRVALSLRPRDADILNEFGLIELQFGNTSDAESAFTEAVNVNPAHAQAWNNLGLASAGRGAMRHARYCFRRAVSLKPDFYTALCNLGLACRQLEQLDEAAAALQEAAALRPGSAEAWLNLGTVLQDQGQLDAALAALEKAAAAAPSAVAVLTALGDLQQRRGAPRLAERFLSQALEREPNDAEARLALAHLRLAEGDFQRGWPLYEARFASRSSPLRRFAVPPWDGAPLEGRSVLVYGEQGLGDEIMFASMLPDLMRDISVCRLLCRAPLRGLFARSFPQAELLTDEQAAALPAGAASCAVAIGSLGGLYRRVRGAFPAHQGYLTADSARVAHWRTRLKAAGPGPYVGIAWRGGLPKTGRALRSLVPAMLEPLLRAVPVSWVSLQHDAGQDELRAFPAIQRWEAELALPEDLAALVCSLDLVITVCSTVVHLAGALGRPTWVLTPQAPAWRYQLEGQTLPWYPSARLFRQSTAGDWPSVITAAAAALRQAGWHER
jgi:Tfp pilus assembly protein PilF